MTIEEHSMYAKARALADEDSTSADSTGPETPPCWIIILRVDQKTDKVKSTAAGSNFNLRAKPRVSRSTRLVNISSLLPVFLLQA